MGRNLRHLASAVLLTVAASSPAFASPYTGLVVLGDSLSDQGNLFAATTVLGGPIGQPAQPASDHYYLGRFSNGPIYAEALAHDLGVSITNSLAGGTNFAFGGARTDYNTVEVPPFGTQIYPHDAYPWSLNGQRQAFTTYASTHGADPSALYVVFSGSNDVTDIVTRRKPAAPTIAGAVKGITDTIDAFKAAGAKSVLVPNLPDIGVTPQVRALEPTVPGISALATGLVRRYNVALSAALDAETGIHIIRFDTFDFLDEVVAHPTAFGLTNSTDACFSGFVVPDPTATVCANPDQYVFWDKEHPTTAFHTLLGDAMFGVAVPEPMTLGLLGCGLVALALSQTRQRRLRRSP